jgi:uncharacterized protein (UPF0332 family)
VSPRSAEYLAQARTRLAAGDAARRDGYPFMALGAAYYAMLYAARAALSEEGLHAKTHRGVWALFRRELVVGGRFEDELVRAAERARELREAADYEAAAVTDEQAAAALADARRFVAAVSALLEG